jgi:hypothetical protein
LDLDRRLDRIECRWKLGQRVVTGRVDHPASVISD